MIKSEMDFMQTVADLWPGTEDALYLSKETMTIKQCGPIHTNRESRPLVESWENIVLLVEKLEGKGYIKRPIYAIIEHELYIAPTHDGLHFNELIAEKQETVKSEHKHNWRVQITVAIVEAIITFLLGLLAGYLAFSPK